MPDNDDADAVTKAATDAVFEEGTPITAPPDRTARATGTARGAAEPDEQAAPVDPAVLLVPPTVKRADPPVRDYVRELGQEFQEQQDEGKL